MVTQDIKENIRFFKPNDPYYYEVDNLPLIDLLNNDKILRDEINLILTGNANYASEAYVQTNIQAAIGSAAEVDIDGDGSTIPTNIIAWINQQNFLTETATNLGDLLDVDLTNNTPIAGNTLIYDTAGATAKWVAGGQQRQGIQYLPERYFIVGQEKTGAGSDSHSKDFVGVTDRNPNTNIAWQTNWGSTTSRSPSDHFCMDSYQGYDFTGPNNSHRTFTWTRRFADIGLPDNTKRIYCRFSLLVYATPGSDIANEDTWQTLYHLHGDQGPAPDPTAGHATLLDGYILHPQAIKEIRTEKLSTTPNLAYENQKNFDYIIDYRTPLENFGSPNHTNYASNTPNSMLAGKVLRHTLVFYNATSIADISLYVYAYEAWD